MPDFAYDEMKKLFPGADDDEMIQKIAALDQPTPPVAEAPAPLIDANPSADAPDYKQMAIQNVKDKYGLDDKYSDASRQKLVDDIKQQSSGPNWAAGLAALGTGIAGGNAASAADSIKKNQIADRENQITQFDLGKKQALASRDDATAQENLRQENLIDSPQSRMAQDLAISMGMDPDQARKNLTAAKFKAFSPLMEKKYDIAQQIQGKKDIADQAAEAKRDVATTNAQARQDALAEAKLKHSDDVQDKALTSAQQLLESARGNPAAAQAERDIYAAQKANSLANMYGDPNKLSERQVKLLVSEVGKIAQGGNPTMGELEGLAPSTLTGKLSRWWEKLSNSPTSANAAEFVKQYQDYANSIAKDAQKVITDKYGRVIEARKDQLGPKNYKSLQDQYLNRFTPPAGSSEGSMNAGSSGDMKSPDQFKMVGGKKYQKVPGGWQEVQ